MRVAARHRDAMTESFVVTVRCFAAVRELLGCDRIECALAPGATVAELRAELLRREPRLSTLQVAWAVNQAYAREDRELQHGDEIALIPPISGGSPDADVFRLDFVRGPIDARELERQARTDRDGAVCAFTGTARDHNDGAAVEQLAYEAYEEMAHKVVARIVDEVFAQHAITRVRVAHRLGVVPVGEAAVVVVTSAPHRAPAFDACRAIMDRIKKEAPIWKRERLRDGAGERWIGDLPRVDPDK
jgi:MoaE-MoaD fusion protein